MAPLGSFLKNLQLMEILEPPLKRGRPCFHLSLASPDAEKQVPACSFIVQELSGGFGQVRWLSLDCWRQHPKMVSVKVSLSKWGVMFPSLPIHPHDGIQRLPVRGWMRQFPVYRRDQGHALWHGFQRQRGTRFTVEGIANFDELVL